MFIRVFWEETLCRGELVGTKILKEKVTNFERKSEKLRCKS